MKLRDYQIKFIDEIRESVKRHRRIIACAATGSGKSKVFISIAKSAIQRNRTVLILTESTKIFSQISDELKNATEINSESSRWINIAKASIYVAMAQTLARRKSILEQLISLHDNLIIINDEAHIGTANKIIELMPNALLIGFTATPDFRVAKHLPRMYNDCVVGPQPQELIEGGYLAPYRHFAREGADFKALKKVNGEFSEKSQLKAFDKPEVVKGILQDINGADFKKAMIFCSSIKHAELLKEQIPGAVIYHSKQTNSAYQLYQFTQASARICISVGALTKGFDFPEIDAVFLNRATTSLPLYLQMIGRASRIFNGKSIFTVYDYGGNAARLGLWNIDRDWGNLWKGKQRNTIGVAPVKHCPNCGYIMAPSIGVCPNCGYIMAKEVIQSDKPTVLIELTSKYNDLRGREISTLSPNELAVYCRMTNRKAFCKRIAMSNGNDYLNNYAKEMGWKRGWNRFITADPGLPFMNITIK